MNATTESSNHNTRHKPAPPPLSEKIVAAVGFVLFVAIVGYLLYDSFTGNGLPPDIRIEVAGIHEAGDDYLVLFEAHNSGGKTASGVVIVGEIRRFGIVVEEAEVTLDYLPSNSKRGGGFFFSHDPRKTELSLSASSYLEP